VESFNVSNLCGRERLGMSSTKKTKAVSTPQTVAYNGYRPTSFLSVKDSSGIPNTAPFPPLAKTALCWEFLRFRPANAPLVYGARGTVDAAR